MGAMGNLNSWEAGAGYGVDALGRPSYQNQFSMGAGPRDHLAQAAIHNDLKARAAAEDPNGMAIRQLLEQMQRQNLPGRTSIPVFPLVPGGNSHYEAHVNNGGGGQ